MENKKIKVMHAIRQGKIGGGESHVLDLVGELNSEIFESIVLSFTHGPMVERLRKSGIKTYVIETEKPFNFMIWGQVEKIMIEENISLVHAHGTRANSNTNYAARKLGIPIIYTVHGWSFHPNQRYILKKMRIYGEKYLVNNSNLTICVSDSNLIDAKKHFAIEKVKIIKNGINLEKFNPHQSFKDIRTEIGISTETTLVGYMVRMTIQKDPLTLVKAISMIPNGLDIKFLFVGDGDLKQAAIQLAAKLGIEDRIIFMGFRQDIPDVLNAIDIYCLPSLWEGLPIGMLEAMAMKKAVLVTAIDGAKEVIVDKQNGLLIPPQNPTYLAETLKLLMQKELRIKLGDAASRTILGSYNVLDMVRQIEQAYCFLLPKIG